MQSGGEALSCLGASAQRACASAGLRRRDLREQAFVFPFYNGIAFAGSGFQPGPVERGDMPALIFDQPRFLQVASGLRNPLATDAKHVGYQLLCHHQFV